MCVPTWACVLVSCIFHVGRQILCHCASLEALGIVGPHFIEGETETHLKWLSQCHTTNHLGSCTAKSVPSVRLSSGSLCDMASLGWVLERVHCFFVCWKIVCSNERVILRQVVQFKWQGRFSCNFWPWKLGEKASGFLVETNGQKGSAQLLGAN